MKRVFSEIYDMVDPSTLPFPFCETKAPEPYRCAGCVGCLWFASEQVKPMTKRPRELSVDTRRWALFEFAHGDFTSVKCVKHLFAMRRRLVLREQRVSASRFVDACIAFMGSSVFCSLDNVVCRIEEMCNMMVIEMHLVCGVLHSDLSADVEPLWIGQGRVFETPTMSFFTKYGPQHVTFLKKCVSWIKKVKEMDWMSVFLKATMGKSRNELLKVNQNLVICGGLAWLVDSSLVKQVQVAREFRQNNHLYMNHVQFTAQQMIEAAYNERQMYLGSLQSASVQIIDQIIQEAKPSHIISYPHFLTDFPFACVA